VSIKAEDEDTTDSTTPSLFSKQVSGVCNAFDLCNRFGAEQLCEMSAKSYKHPPIPDCGRDFRDEVCDAVDLDECEGLGMF